MWPRKCRNTPYIKDLGYYNDYDIIPGLYFAYYDIAKFEMNISKTTNVFSLNCDFWTLIKPGLTTYSKQ